MQFSSPKSIRIGEQGISSFLCWFVYKSTRLSFFSWEEEEQGNQFARFGIEALEGHRFNSMHFPFPGEKEKKEQWMKYQIIFALR